MSELINNREVHIEGKIVSEGRLAILEGIFLGLYKGRHKADVQDEFDKKIGKVTVEEVTHLSHFQRQLLESEGLTKSEVQKLSDDHMDILKGKILDKQRPEDEPGHPIHTFKLENRELERLIETRVAPHTEQFAREESTEAITLLLEDCNLLYEVDKHYVRKEHLIFPYLEKYGIFGPSTNMWRINDFIREGIKELRQKLATYNGDKASVLESAQFVIEQVLHMVYREENILFPMCLDKLTEDEWMKIALESDEIGYCLISAPAKWKPERNELPTDAMSEGFIKLETGILSLKQLELMLNHLPIDITFIDENDVVRYFSFGKERIFPRTKAIIGRTVQNCHPPKSVHIVEEILHDFKSGKKDSEDFWIKARGKYVYIRYFAVRDEDGNYGGTLEFTQNIEPIQGIQGEKRILAMD
ncbi:hypothetical protein AM500_17185 [Bacillus sp. FJAT-18017]|uniref:DUF438 domain-containing protein n=1 Tax=Bacillus sp. FJAT-18017 TaxID=1705566 RepID=UPI0006B0224B|nr:DUF438 domain-containing protein [Bacillus sp. FJAT-18017]ALC91338.1 hypothetical protein AM500_17185 [Bacillus sp. FJAT-18017]